jgi:hypothetical protein
VKRIASSAFCTGTNDRGWRATPDWLLRPDTAAKVLEGKYDDLPEMAFYMVGPIEEAQDKAKELAEKAAA